MRLFKRCIEFVCVAILSAFGGAAASARSAKTVLTADEGILKLVVFPGRAPWVGFSGRSRSEPRTVAMTGTYVVRQSHGARRDLLFAVESPELAPQLTVGMYAVSLKEGVTIRSASRKEWERATPLPSGPTSSRFLERHSHFVLFRGKEYLPPAGAEFGGAFPSPDERRIAIIGVKPYPSTKMPGPLGGGPDEGEIYLDIYDAESGQRVSGGRIVGIFAFSYSRWAGNDFFVMPVQYGLTSCVVAVLSIDR